MSVTSHVRPYHLFALAAGTQGGSGTLTLGSPRHHTAGSTR